MWYAFIGSQSAPLHLSLGRLQYCGVFTLRQLTRTEIGVKDTLISEEGHWEQEPKFIFRVHLDLAHI